MTRNGGTQQAMCVDLMKVLRHQAMTHTDICRELGWRSNTVTKWLREFEAQGLVLVTKPPLMPTLYRLAPEWRGVKPLRPKTADSQWAEL